MSNVRGEFCFHGVGQGMFYSGILTSYSVDGPRQQFSFVYDCGSMSKKKFLDEKILDYKELLDCSKKKNKKTLDLLIISHLHDDHINGLEKLLKNVEIKTVVMPYYTESKLVLAAMSATEITPFLRRFYTDPIKYFRSQGIKQINQIDYYENKRKDYDEEPNTKESQSSRGSQIIFNDNKINTLKNNEKDEKSVTDRPEVTIHYKSAFSNLDEFGWEFIFKNLDINEVELIKYENFLKKFLINNKIINYRKIIKSKRLMKKLKKECIDTMSWMLNKTSTVVYHGPKNIHSDNEKSITFFCNNGMYVPNYDDKSGTLLTGDIDFDNNDIMNYYKDVIKDVALASVPHHGCWLNWETWNKSKYEIPHFVISYGSVNTHGHPSKNVVDDIINRNITLSLVNEKNDLSYSVFA